MFKAVTSDDDLLVTEGSVEGGTFRFKAAHFEWLLAVGAAMNIDFNDMGKRHHGCSSTIFFCDALKGLYGSAHGETALAASFAVENWAAAGFWDELVEGWKGINARKPPSERVPVSFWTYHAALEAQHADHTVDELKQVYCAGRIHDEDHFLDVCDEILDAIDVFWTGLDQRRLGLPLNTPFNKYLHSVHEEGGSEPPMP